MIGLNTFAIWRHFRDLGNHLYSAIFLFTSLQLEALLEGYMSFSLEQLLALLVELTGCMMLSAATEAARRLFNEIGSA